MGLDQHLLRVRNLKQCKQPDFWDNVITRRDNDSWEYDNFEKPAILWYGRKFWDLHEYIFTTSYENGEFVEVDKATLERMLDFATHNTDFFGGFNGVLELCRALYDYDAAHERGWIYVYEADW